MILKENVVEFKIIRQNVDSSFNNFYNRKLEIFNISPLTYQFQSQEVSFGNED